MPPAPKPPHLPDNWSLENWVAHLDSLDPPIKPVSLKAFHDLEAARGQHIAPKEYAQLLLKDALLALRLLKLANQRLPRHLRHDISTPLGVILALGAEQSREILHTAPVVQGIHFGYLNSESRSTLAARVASAWGALRYDLDPDELALAVLLANTGELLLWLHAPHLPAHVQALLRQGSVARSEEAQLQACGFTFRDLTLRLCELWNLPELIQELIRGEEHRRARSARLAVDIARHFGNGPDDPALPWDILNAARLLDSDPATVMTAFSFLEEGDRDGLLARVEALKAAQAEESDGRPSPV